MGVQNNVKRPLFARIFGSLRGKSGNGSSNKMHTQSKLELAENTQEHPKFVRNAEEELGPPFIPEDENRGKVTSFLRRTLSRRGRRDHKELNSNKDNNIEVTQQSIEIEEDLTSVVQEINCTLELLSQYNYSSYDNDNNNREKQTFVYPKDDLLDQEWEEFTQERINPASTLEEQQLVLETCVEYNEISSEVADDGNSHKTKDDTKPSRFKRTLSSFRRRSNRQPPHKRSRLSGLNNEGFTDKNETKAGWIRRSFRRVRKLRQQRQSPKVKDNEGYQVQQGEPQNQVSPLRKKALIKRRLFSFGRSVAFASKAYASTANPVLACEMCERERENPWYYYEEEPKRGSDKSYDRHHGIKCGASDIG